MFYVVMDRTAAEVLSRKVASPVVLIEDNVLVGPSSKDLARHRAMRTKSHPFQRAFRDPTACMSAAERQTMHEIA
jgi:hypothetical protein